MLKKGLPALFRLGSSRSESATASEHQQLGVVDVRRLLKNIFNGLLD